MPLQKALPTLPLLPKKNVMERRREFAQVMKPRAHKFVSWLNIFRVKHMHIHIRGTVRVQHDAKAEHHQGSHGSGAPLAVSTTVLVQRLARAVPVHGTVGIV